MVKANELAGLPNPAGPVAAAALAWADVSPAADGSGVAIVRRSKTDVEAQSQAVYLDQAGMAALAASGPTVGADAARDAHVPIDVLRGDAGAAELQGLRFRVAARLTGDALPAGSDVAVSVFHGFYHPSTDYTFIEHSGASCNCHL